MNAAVERHQLVNQNSGNYELYTPPEIVDAMRAVMGGFDLDPASSKLANKTVKAKKIYTEADDGLVQPWFGNVWLNHPFGAKETVCKSNCKKVVCQRRGWHRDKEFPGNKAWIDRMVRAYETGEVDQVGNIVFCSTSEAWFQPLLWYPQCFLHGRTEFIDPNAGGDKKPGGAPKGCVVTYLGPNVKGFARVFSGLGTVKVMHPGGCHG